MAGCNAAWFWQGEWFWSSGPKSSSVVTMVLVSGPDCSLKKKFYIYNINELMIQTQKYLYLCNFIYQWINELLSEENKLPEHCVRSERWQGPPRIDTVEQNQLCRPLSSVCLFSHEDKENCSSVNEDLSLLANKTTDCSFNVCSVHWLDADRSIPAHELWYNHAVSGSLAQLQFPLFIESLSYLWLWWKLPPGSGSGSVPASGASCRRTHGQKASFNARLMETCSYCLTLHP